MAALATALMSSATTLAAATYEAPDSCRSEAELQEAIRARLGDDDARVIPDYRLVIKESPTRFIGEIEMAGEFRRSLVAPTCDDVLDGATLIIAMRVAEMEAETERVSERAPTQSEPLPSVHVPSALEQTPPKPAASASGVAPRPRSGSSYAVSAGGGVWGGVAPKLVWGPVIAVALRTNAQNPWSLRLGAERAASGTVETQPAAIWTRLTTGSLTACAFLLGRAPALEICLQARAGVFEAGGVAQSPIVRTERISQPWVAMGPTLRAELGLIRHLWLSWELGAPVPLTRERLVFRQPDALIHETSPILAGLQISLEWRSAAEPERSKSALAGMARQ